MQTIISSIILNNDKEALEQIANSEYLSPQEKEWFDFISETLANSGSLPSQELLMRTYPEIQFVEPMKDVSQYIANFIKKRENLHQSQEMMKLASKVSKEGLVASDLDRFTIRQPKKESVIQSPQTYLDNYHKNKDKPRGITLNIKVIDDLIGTVGYGDTLSIFGFTSHGKSLLGDNIVFHNVFKNSYNACVINLEIPKKNVLDNLLVRYSVNNEYAEYPNLTYQKLHDMSLNEAEYEFLESKLLPDFYDYTNHGKVVILDITDFEDFSKVGFKNKLIQVNNECIQETGYPLDIVMVDHVNLLKFMIKTKSSSEFEAVNDYVKFFHDLAVSFTTTKEGEIQQLIMILLAQIGRTSFKKAAKNKGKYDTTAIAEINEVERSSQFLVPIYMSQEMKLSKEASVQLLKNRNGPTEEEPQIIYSDPEHHLIGDESEGFADMLSMDELEDVFGGGSISDLF